MQNSVQKAIQLLKEGGVVIFPTDTAFGIGCRIDMESSVKRLFKLRRRPVTQATPVLASSLQMLEPYIKPVDDEVIQKLIKPFWPGGLTIVLPCYSEKVPQMVRSGDTLGVRVPNHVITLQIIDAVGVPIIGSSANFPGSATPYKFEDLDPELVQLVDYVVSGETFSKEASTVISIVEKPWKILRQGAVEVTV